ncbi:flagellar basal body-associated FliL family protein [Sulfitobacter sp. 1151]|uniref:Flagellar protein FliL n=1 Tax=Parasulfitobacter algicola TaxID=2614809 RepID=A0ABX2IRM9_9RHOB|nr:flagellar basal body-associated FliL family protein [Sulfitobacter algicola]
MKKIILPLLLASIGTAAGVGAGIFLKAPPEETAEHTDGEKDETHAQDAQKDDDQGDAKYEESGDFQYVKMNNQFVVPIVDDGAVSALVVLSLSLEISEGQQSAVFQREPRLRDGFLQILFDHANLGGFTGTFTNSNNMNTLRMGLREVAKNVLGDIANDVLITDIVRQDI